MEALREWGICKINPLMWLTIWREHIDSLINNTYKKSLIVTRKPKRSHTYTHEDLDTLSPNKRVKRDIIEEISDSEETLEPSIETPPSPCPYVASPSWVIPDSQDNPVQNILPHDVLNSLLNDPFTECKFDEEEAGQKCINQGADCFRSNSCTLFQ